jgi:hypothetical protein
MVLSVFGISTEERSMREKYYFGYSDPRAMYGEPDVKWEFLEAQPWQPNFRPWFTVLIVLLFIRGWL